MLVEEGRGMAVRKPEEEGNMLTGETDKKEDGGKKF